MSEKKNAGKTACEASEEKMMKNALNITTHKKKKKEEVRKWKNFHGKFVWSNTNFQRMKIEAEKRVVYAQEIVKEEEEWKRMMMIMVWDRKINWRQRKTERINSLYPCNIFMKEAGRTTKRKGEKDFQNEMWRKWMRLQSCEARHSMLEKIVKLNCKSWTFFSLSLSRQKKLLL